MDEKPVDILLRKIKKTTVESHPEMPIAEKVYKSLYREKLVEIDKKVKEERAQ